jgi:hypothetical protein
MLGERRALAAEAAPMAATPAEVHLASTSPTSRVDKVSAQHAPPTHNASHPAALEAAAELAKTSTPAPAASTAGQLDSNKLGLVAAMLLVHHARVEAERAAPLKWCCRTKSRRCNRQNLLRAPFATSN